MLLSYIALSGLLLTVVASAQSGVPGIIEQSVRANTRDWNAQEEFSFDECATRSKIDAEGHVKPEWSKTFAVLMIDGSPYRRLLAIDGEPLSAAEDAEEQVKLDRERADRRAEDSSQRHSRIKKYQAQREEENLLMQQMAVAFDFSLLGEALVNGTACYHLRALPKAAYTPPVQKARVLRGMRGEMWIDKRAYHWVKVEAEVTEPVTFGFFIAKVNPGTRFRLEQAARGSVWLPSHFIQTVNASVLGLYGYRTRDEFVYSAYRPEQGVRGTTGK